MAKDIKEITEQLEQGVKAVYESDKYKEYLDFMSRFYTYSVNNIMLIMMQKPDATLVAGYNAWKNKFKRQVRKGETGITIIAPVPHKVKKEVDGEEVERTYTTYKATTVFDVAQTDGENLPTGCCEQLEGNVEGFAGLIDKLVKFAPVPVEFNHIESAANGFYSHADKKIVVDNGLSELQRVKTLIHEIAHSILHEKDNGEEKDADRHTKEVQAESVAYTVCNMLGLDTADYSFGYVAGWSNGKEVKELIASMEVIRKIANEIYKNIAA